MDLQLANPTGTEGGLFARVGVLLCFGVACGLLVGSLSIQASNSNGAFIHQSVVEVR